MNQQEAINTIALTRIGSFSLAGMLELYRRVGSATEIISNSRNIRDILPDASDRLVEAFTHTDDAIRRAETEYAQDTALGIDILTLNDERYPARLRECPDAPLVLFWKGNTNLNPRRAVSIVGTRHATSYGQDLIRSFLADLRKLCPSTLIISGLAYGIDICAHREALRNGLDTVGVLAHGLDELYPALHRQTAEEMLTRGGLLTEFMLQTRIDKVNFVRRNRIVAGIADAVVLVESATRGGGLITTRIAREYNRDVCAFPGAVGRPYSEGCNNLIREQAAALITSASDFVETIGWTSDQELAKAHSNGIERQIFPDLTEEEQRVVDILMLQNDLQANAISIKSGIAAGRLTALLFSLEIKGIVQSRAGGTYHLIK